MSTTKDFQTPSFCAQLNRSVNQILEILLSRNWIVRQKPSFH